MERKDCYSWHPVPEVLDENFIVLVEYQRHFSKTMQIKGRCFVSDDLSYMPYIYINLRAHSVNLDSTPILSNIIKKSSKIKPDFTDIGYT